MSVRALAHVLDLAPFSGETLLTLIVVADAADAKGRACIDVETLMRRARVTPIGLANALHRLRDQAWLDVGTDASGYVLQILHLPGSWGESVDSVEKGERR